MRPEEGFVLVKNRAGPDIDAASATGIDVAFVKSEVVVDVRGADSLVEILSQFRIAAAGEVREDVAAGHSVVGRGQVYGKLKLWEIAESQRGQSGSARRR